MKYSKIYFKEVQKFQYAWIFLLLTLSSLTVFSIGLFQQFVKFKPWTADLTGSELIFMACIIPSFFLVIYLVFKNSRLIVTIMEDGVHLEYPPYLRKSKIFSIQSIEKYYYRKYNSFLEYGGSGFKKGKAKVGYAYNVSGNIGIQFIMHSGEKILIGTQKAQEFILALDKIKKVKF